ncbi:MAG: alpha/beta fold hydrolase [Chitinophagaceae bacterium]
MHNLSVKKKVYFLSGLGADQRAFSLLDLSFCQPVFINWLEPERNETLAHYALRLLDQILEPDATLVGLSFGGMIASEMALHRPAFRIIILASNKTSNEFPPYFRVGKYIPLYRWAPNRLYKFRGRINRWFFGARSAEAQSIFSAIQMDSNPKFVKWAISAILKWDLKLANPNIIHIHGTQDRLLPAKFVKAHYLIPGGTHILPLDNSAEISKLLKYLIA